MTIGGFLPSRVIVGGSQYLPISVLSIAGIMLMFLIPSELLDLSRGIGCVFGLLIGTITTFSMTDTLSMPIASGITVGKGIPLIFLGAMFSSFGGFAKPVRSSSFLYKLGFSLLLVGFVSLFLIASVTSILQSQLLRYELLPFLSNISFTAVFVGTISSIKAAWWTIQDSPQRA